jgi:short-subunit dehydrogenase
MGTQSRPLAIVTGASSGIGYELAQCCAKGGFDLLIAADESAIDGAAARLRQSGANVGSIAGFMPGTYQAVYNGTKALLDSFSFALRAELKDSGVTVTCLMPGATETEFFDRADMLDTKIDTEKKQPRPRSRRRASTR